MKVSGSNGFDHGDVVQWRRPCLVGVWKIQFTGVFPLFNATDATLDCKNDLVSSQNAFSTKGSIIIRSLSPSKFGDKISSFADPGCLSWILDPGSQGFGSGSAWIRINLSCWIRIRIRIQIADPDPGRQKWPQKIEKRTEFSSFEVLDVLFWGLKASPVAWESFMEAKV